MLPGYRRTFRGYSRKWGGGVATLVKAPRDTVFGWLANVTAQDLRLLDGYEGVPTSYVRKQVTALDEDDNPVVAVAYVAVSRTFHEPSRAYLEACAETIGSFWTSGVNHITWKDFEVRP